MYLNHDVRQGRGFLQFLPPIKHNMTEILLKVALNTINQTLNHDF